MLTLKHPFAHASEASVKGRQLLRGRTKAKIESLQADLEAARLTLAQAEQVVGDRLIEETDITAATEAMRQAGERVKTLELALIVAREKDAAAQDELQHAERQVVIEAEAAACERVLALGPRFEEVSALVRQFAVDMARETEALRVAGGNEKYAHPVRQIREQFEFFLRLASHPRTTNFPSALKMYETFTACLVAVCGMRLKP